MPARRRLLPVSLAVCLQFFLGALSIPAVLASADPVTITKHANLGFTTSTPVVLDTGVAVHPDLNVFTNVSFVAGQTTDGNGHGTHVAGIAAALDNGIGVVGVAPGARLWAIKVMDDSGSGITSTVIQGIDYVTQNASQIEVANLSLVGIGNSSALRLAISNSVARGVVVAGLMTIVLPAANAGPSLVPINVSGKFHGVMAPQTPIGWRTTRP